MICVWMYELPITLSTECEVMHSGRLSARREYTVDDKTINKIDMQRDIWSSSS